ncbi:sensor histidine kinase [Butyrivibrio proteoclasticus]|uniref:sensor histidine kinase n=1 Tax=Butyrivibrio proteoclasticus TaxID=43305 RepID=UPI00068763FE|nr:sensor histidine kinase [Butyrivibrio proteoclasticus]
MVKNNPRVRQKSRLATQIRITYLVLLLPNIIFMVYASYTFWTANVRYNDMISSVVTASEFSLDFKEDFDYQTYLLIVGNVSPEETPLNQMLVDARKVVVGLKDYTGTEDNQNRLRSAEKYLTNLGTYTNRIIDNLEHDDKYEANMVIWENDVQIVTALLQETINEYIYYENKQLQIGQAANEAMYLKSIGISMAILVFIIISVIVVSFVGPIWITRPIEEQVKREQKQLRKAEFELLQAQINPHFLYNTLDAIVWSAEGGNKEQVVKMVGSLSSFFRTSLNKGKEIISIEEELAHVRSYLEIQQIRYQDILSYEIDVPQEIYNYKIPKITVQPLVENALYHGIKNHRGGGTIRITGKEEKEFITITVADDGIGMDAKRLEEVRKGLTEGGNTKEAIYGLYNVNQRIILNFGEEYGVSLDSSFEKGTEVTIKLPKNLASKSQPKS